MYPMTPYTIKFKFGYRNGSGRLFNRTRNYQMALPPREARKAILANLKDEKHYFIEVISFREGY